MDDNPNYRWSRFNLRGLFLLIAFVATAVGWWVDHHSKVHSHEATGASEAVATQIDFFKRKRDHGERQSSTTGTYYGVEFIVNWSIEPRQRDAPSEPWPFDDIPRLTSPENPVDSPSPATN